MNKIFSKLDASKKLALIALLLGIAALFIGNPKNSTSIRVNVKELAQSTLNDKELISVNDLAEWIIKGNSDFVLVDLRDSKSYSEYNIPTSINIRLNELLNSNLLRNQKIILYGNDDITAAQAWFILRSDGYKNVYILNGGLEAWKNKILFPVLAQNANTEEKAEFEKIKEISKFFGGTPKIGLTEKNNMPEIEMPVPKMPAMINLQPKKKKREGC
ncbi:rhodanese-like domain-containing protein [Melioribacteraceae bacterium 4301-Me]|uniref:rhodanese-like domain-containing protein n=1 Tax=Pyranulibacter aquaticus TaxID=3163344 RepID=UPI00359909F4